MQIQIEVSNIRCVRVTHPRTDADEPYLAIFVSAGKRGADGKTAALKKCIGKCLSNIRKGVHRGVEWEPTLAAPSGSETTGLSLKASDAEADAFCIRFSMYEADNEELYKKMLGSVEEALEPEDFEWGVIALPSDAKNPWDWLKVIWRILVGLYKYLIQDDFIDRQEITWLKGYTTHSKTLSFRGGGGEYEVTVKLKALG